MAPFIHCGDYKAIVEALLNDKAVSTKWTNEPDWDLVYASFAVYRTPSFTPSKYCIIWPLVSIVRENGRTYLDFTTAIRHVGFYGIRAEIALWALSPDFYRRCWRDFVVKCVEKHREVAA